MPAVQAPAKVLVTGASGFVAIHVIQSYLKHGYSVRGTVRSTAKGEFLKNLFQHPKFEYIIVPDMQTDDAFDEAVKGVQAVTHTASPVTIPAGDPEITGIRPAVQGTLNILGSVKRFGSEVQRVVITSSSVSIVGAFEETHYDETQWNDWAVDLVKEKGEAAGGGPIYCASKTLAERAVWDWQGKNKDVQFDITTLCPPWIWGPIYQDIQRKSDLNVSMAYLISNVENEATGADLTAFHLFYIDARDVSTIHVLATQTEAAGNQRLLTAARGLSWQDVYDSLQESPAIPNTPVGAQPGANKGRKWDASFGQERSAKILGKSTDELFRPLSETIRDAVSSVAAKGW